MGYQRMIDQKAKEEEKMKKKEQLKALTDVKKKKVVKPPNPDQFIVNHPFIAPMDMDIIKLTAQFVARNGQKFLIGLTQRESRNPQFDFLKPTHALFGYFTSLVDAYTKCLMPNKEEVERLKKFAGLPLDILDKALGRFAWDEQEEQQRMGREEEDHVEKEMMGQIDWHDFVVVETIEFTKDDESIPLAAPIDVSTMTPSGAPMTNPLGALKSGGRDEDSDDDPTAKKPRLDDGSLLSEITWIEKFPLPITVLIQVNLGAEGTAAKIPTAIPLELPVRTMVMAMKQLLVPRVAAAGVTLGNLKLKAATSGYIMKNVKTLAFYNIAPGAVIELTKKTRGGK